MKRLLLLSFMLFPVPLFAAFPMGDYDRNCTVDGADYVVWQSHFGEIVPPFSGADGNGNGVIDAADSVVWRDNLGTIVPNCNNQPPMVNAGPDLSVQLPHSLNINATVTDDGLPTPPSLQYSWIKISGPGDAVFTPADAEDTSVTFSEQGTYVLRLVASDQMVQAFAELTVTVFPEPTPPNPDPEPQAPLEPKNYIRVSEGEIYTLPLQMSAPAQMRVEVYSLRGEKIRTLIDAHLSTSTDVTWNGRNDSGNLVGSDVYLVWIYKNDSILQKKKVVIQR